ncbi:carboxymuconolactone decarboxylase family protein [Paracoccus sp. SCSIO 75233]|uniref:carboxymuconolactone decarboxylase family protein n=1 Tax=Paracoccus sp. SCSIO 75233 TaxID=3017782 RepID=UPI0022F03541|nr:carboxymuconolactone decarboxylase family protein [Paracoccus sp. SCSIO 75233]WBU52416.1 carboxymuconolactone decarboxylase family protein [Paracoccus sp. SCSIO 75233]
MNAAEKGRSIQVDMFGDDMMARRAETTTPFNKRIRDLIETYCFGEVWGDETLTKRERSLLVMAILATLGRTPQLRLHIGAGITNGCTAEEIREVMAQVAIYAGIPAGVEGTEIAEGVIKG